MRSVAAAILLLAAGATACNGDSETVERDAAVYAAVIEAVVGEEPIGDLDDPLELVVWVYPLDDDPIDLEVQVEVLVLLEEFATVRFVDEFDEAVKEDRPQQPVLEGGVVVGLGPVTDGDLVSVRAERYTGEGSPERLRIEVRRSGDDWRADITGR